VATRRDFGTIEQLTSGRHRARYDLPDGVRIKAPTTFTTKKEAQAWLARERVRIEQEAANSPTGAHQAAPLFRDYAPTWIETRRTKKGPLRATTRRDYEGYLERHLLTAFGAKRLDEITPTIVKAWYAKFAVDTTTHRARVYSFLSTLMKSAVTDDLIAANPCRIYGAKNTAPVTKVVVLTPAEVYDLAEQMRADLALAVHLGAWCTLRIGEILELRRGDIVGDVIHVRRATTWVDGASVVDGPKTDAGERLVTIPGHLTPMVAEHLSLHTGRGSQALLFTNLTGGQLSVQGYSDAFSRARRRAELPQSLRQHHLRHTGLTLAAQTGATVKEMQLRAGHATPGIAMRYQHADQVRDRALADGLSKLVEDAMRPAPLRVVKGAASQ
jgi:integrase